MNTYEISYHDTDQTSKASGLTAGQAKYSHFGIVGDCFENFRDFLMCVKSVCKVAHISGSYDYIERQYGKVFQVGERVVIVGEGSATGKIGEVIHPSGNGAYVHVFLDGHKCLFHPMSLSHIEATKCER